MTPRITPKKNQPSGLPDDRRNPQSDNSAHEREMEAELHSIYDSADDAKPDMTRLVQVRHSAFKKFLVGLTVFFAVLAAVSWAGVFFFSPTATKFGGEGVTVDVEGPTEVKSGDTVTYAVHYKNAERVALGTASMELRLPKEFKLLSADPAGEENSWKIGSVAPGKDGLITVKGVVLAPMSKELTLQAILTYRPADFNSEFQKVSTKGMTITDSVLDMQVGGPAKVLPGDKVALTYTYKNNAASDFEHLKVHADYPANFIPEKATPPSADTDLKVWDVAKLKAGDTGKITVEGSFASDAEGKTDFKGSIGFLDADEAFQLQKEGTFSTDVIKGDLVTALILNGKSEDQPVRFGDTLRYAITYKNTGTAVLGDVQLSATLDSTPADGLLQWKQLVDKAGGTRSGNTITWTKKQIPSLGRVNPGDQGTLDFEIPFAATPPAGVKDGVYQVASSVQAVIATIDETDAGRTAKSSPVVAKAVSDTALTAQLRYFNTDGIPVGSGPLPPKVDEATTYRAVIEVDNSLHELQDLKLTAKLPSNVRFTGVSNVDAGDLRFDAANSKMVWTLNWLPTNIKKLNITFDVAITPGDDQRGKFPTVVDGIIFEATDKSNGFPMLLSASPLSTSTDGDAQAAGKGRVQ